MGKWHSRQHTEIVMFIDLEPGAEGTVEEIEVDAEPEAEPPPEGGSGGEDSEDDDLDQPFEDMESLKEFLSSRKDIFKNMKEAIQRVNSCSQLKETVNEMTEDLKRARLDEFELVKLRKDTTERHIVTIQEERHAALKELFQERKLKDSQIAEFVELKEKVEESIIEQASTSMIRDQITHQNHLEKKSSELEPEKLEWTSKIDAIKESNASLDQEIRAKGRSIRKLRNEIQKFRNGSQKMQDKNMDEPMKPTKPNSL